MNMVKILMFLLSLSLLSCAQEQPVQENKAESKTATADDGLRKGFNKLTAQEKHIILDKGTERAFSGKYWNNKADGIYLCRQCDTPLFDSPDQFKSGTGWPSFDDMIGKNVLELTDQDGERTEVVCKTCEGHLGHSFKGEGMTAKSVRHCVNSASLNFVDRAEAKEKAEAMKVEKGRAIFASGCFWGTEYWLEKAPGVLSATSGYIGGHKKDPTYQEVCYSDTGHAEAVEVIFDRKKTSFEALAKLFFETHDPSQLNRQGPDRGPQYRSGIFYIGAEQKQQSEKLIANLREKGHKVVTEITEATKFYPAEAYHQDYYEQKNKKPYCHFYEKKF